MNSEILLVYKRSDLPLPAKHSAHWNTGITIWVFSFQDPAITLSQSYPSKVMKVEQKSQLRDTADTVLKMRDKFKLHLGKRKSTLFKTIKSHFLELEIPLVTHIYSIFKVVSCLVFAHGLCTRNNLLWDRHSP